MPADLQELRQGRCELVPFWIDEGNFSTRVIYGTPAVSQSTASFDLGARAVIDLSSLLLIHANCKGSAGSQKQCPI